MNQEENIPGQPDIRELVLELNFVPSWARKPPGAKESADFDRPAMDRDSRQRPDRNDRPRRPDAPRRMDSRRMEPRRPEPRFIPRPEPLPVRLSFLPDQKQLSALMRQLRAAKKAYPLMNVATLLTTKPEYSCVKLEIAKNTDQTLFQCKTCKVVAMDRDLLAAHILKTHAGDYFDREETVGEPPAGAFVCVARCGLSGALLGPPNHHSYVERVQELHRMKFSHMSLDEYRKHVQTVHDAALVEQWREEARKSVVYRLKNAPAAEAEPKSWMAAETYFTAHFLPSLIIRVHRAVLPVSTMLALEDRRLAQTVQEAWQREVRFPRTLMFAMRAAFRNKDLYLFKVGQGWDYVSAVQPSPLDPAHTIPAIREVLNHLKANPGCRRAQMLEALRPGQAPDSPVAAEVLSPLSWLIEKGHIIEFFDGALAVPLQAVQRTVSPEPEPEIVPGTEVENASEVPEADASAPAADTVQ